MPEMTGRRGLTAAVVGTAIGAGLMLLGATRVWWVQTVPQPAPLRPQEIVHTGASLAPVLPALGWVALAGAGGLIATRGSVRRLVGGLLFAVGMPMFTGGSVRLDDRWDGERAVEAMVNGGISYTGGTSLFARETLDVLSARGIASVSVPSLPAANTLTIPASPTASIAAFSTSAGEPSRKPPQLLLVTRILMPRCFNARM